MPIKNDRMKKMVLKCGEYKKVGCCYLDESLYVDVLTALKAGKALADERKEIQADRRPFINKFWTYLGEIIHKRRDTDTVSKLNSDMNDKKQSFCRKSDSTRSTMRLTIPGISEISLMDKRRRKEEEERKRKIEIKNLISESKTLYEVRINEINDTVVEVDIVCFEGTIMDSRWFKKSAKWLYRHELMKDYMLY